MLGEGGDDEGVGHHEPDGEEEAGPEVGDEHVSGVDEGEEEHADAGDELAECVEDEDGDGEEQGHEDGFGAEGDGAEYREHECCGDEADGELDGGGAVDDGGCLFVECAIAVDIEEVVEGCAKGVEPDACDESGGEEVEEWCVVDGWGCELVVGVESCPEDDEPEVGDSAERGGDACELEGGRDGDEGFTHGGILEAIGSGQ